MENAWNWSSRQEPSTYDELVDGLQQAAETHRHPSYRTRFSQLAHVFDWCRRNGFDLAYLEVDRHWPKYLEATAYLKRLTSSDEPDGAEIAQVREAIACIKSDANREAARRWAQGKRLHLVDGVELRMLLSRYGI